MGEQCFNYNVSSYRNDINKKFSASLVALMSLTLNDGLIESEPVTAPSSLGQLSLHHDDGFMIEKDSNMVPVLSQNIDRDIRLLPTARLAALLKSKQAYVSVGQNSADEYTMQLHGRLKGGGVWGAKIGAFIGKGFGIVVGHLGSIAVGAIVRKVTGKTNDNGDYNTTGNVTGGTAIAVTKGLTKPAVEAFSNACAVAGGMIGGVLTGPV